jgi:aldehyde dehydrogenase (NAD+)
VDRAVSAARAAFEGPWRDFAATARGATLHRIAALLKRDQELLAAIDSYDNGKVSIATGVTKTRSAFA